MNPTAKDIQGLGSTSTDSEAPVDRGLFGSLIRKRNTARHPSVSQCETSSVQAPPGRQVASGSEVVLDRLSKRFAGKTVLDELSLTLESGSFFAILGPSGSGKSTLLNLISGFEQPDSGDIRIRGRSVVGVPPYARQVGVVFQNYALFPHLSVAQNLAYPLERKRVRRDKIGASVGKMLELVQLGGYGNLRITQLSGGQQQRVALARALIAEPDVLLMDEPMAALDKSLRDDLQIEIKQLQKSLGTTVIYITHDQREALALADRIGVLNAGRFEQIDDAVKIYAKPASAFVARFLTGATIISGQAFLSSDGRWGLDADGAVLPAHWGGDTPSWAGVKARFAINPTAIQILSSDDERTRWSLDAQVTASMYVGDSTIFHLAIAGGVVLSARIQGAQVRSVGEWVKVHWRSEDAFLFRD